MWDPLAEFEETTLDNGLKIYASHWPNRSWQALGFIIHCGSFDDPAGLEGIAHFIEHLIAQDNTNKRKKLESLIESKGGEYPSENVNWSRILSKFFIPADISLFSKISGLVGENLLFTNFDGQIDHQRKIILKEFDTRFDEKGQKRSEFVTRKLYKGTRFEKTPNVIGTLKSIKKITADDLNVHRKKFITPANISVVTVGGIKTKEVIKALAKSPFGQDLPGFRNPPLPPITEFIPLTKEDPPKGLMRKSKKLQVFTNTNFVRIPGNVDVITVMVFAKLFGDILHQEFRHKKSLCYSIFCMPENTRGLHEIRFGVNELNKIFKDSVDAIINDCLLKMNDSEKEFHNFIESRIKSSKLMDIAGRQLFTMASDALSENQKILTYSDEIRRLEKLTIADIADLLKWFTPDNTLTINY